jgi:toxin-antitoxin system PIN domain toxin
VVTNPKLGSDRFTVDEAVSVVEEWLEQPNIRLLAPGDRHWPILRSALVDGQARGPLVTDAQLAALTIEYGGVLHTTDRDFARFPSLRWKNPLQR